MRFGERQQVDWDAAVYYNTFAADGDLTCSRHPIYRTAAGEIYLTPSIVHMSLNRTDGGYFTLEGETGGDAADHDVQFTVRFHPAMPCETVRFHQYDAARRELAAAEFPAHALPESLRWEDGATYLLVEKLYTDQSGQERATYDAVNRSAKSYSLPVFENGDPIAANHTVELRNSAQAAPAA